MTTIKSFEGLSDSSLLGEADRLAAATRASTADLVAALAELDKRRLYLALGYSSLFAYCTSRLRLTEGEAFNRIEAARAVRRFPALLPHLSAGSLSLTAIRLLAPHLTPANCDSVVKSAEFQGTRAIETLVAHLRPQPPVPSVVRKLPTPAVAARGATSNLLLVAGTLVAAQGQAVPTPPAHPFSHRPIVKPLSAESYRLQITMSRDTHDKLRKAQALMRHRVPNGDPATIVDQALDALIREVEKTKCARVARPRANTATAVGSRHIPSSVKRAVWKRDDARCVFEGPNRQRCGAIEFLEFHHVIPYARGGKATVENIELRCRAHNAYEAENDFGLFVKENRPGYEARPA